MNTNSNIKSVSIPFVVMLSALTIFPYIQIGDADASFSAGPYNLNMYFDELPSSWWNESWWNTNWTSRQKLRFDTQSLSQNLVDFPILVMVNDSRIDYSRVLDTGDDIRFIDSDGQTELDYEIETWNESGNSIMWVKIPVLDGGSKADYIWMYYENPNATDKQNPTGVWSSNYLMVQHLDETARTAGGLNDHFDSTAGNHALEAIMEDSHMDVTWRLNGADDFDGVDDYLDSGGREMNSCEYSGSIELWIKPDDNVSTTSIFSTEENRDRAIWIENGQFYASMADSLFTSRKVFGGSVDQAWQFIAFSWDINNGTLFLYVNGVLVDNDVGPSWSTIGRMSPTRYGHFEGFNLDWPIRGYFDGMMDELRVSGAVRSNDWNAAQYLSMTDSLFTFEAEARKYHYRTKITITAGSQDMPVDYPTSITVDHATLVSTGRSKPNGDDLRLVYRDISGWVELDRKLDPSSSWNTTSTRLWFTLQRGINALSSDGNYYIYNGAPFAVNPPDYVKIPTRVKSVQSGNIVHAINGTITVGISPVNITKSFLVFSSRHNNNRPVGSEIRGRISTATLLEFVRVSDEVVLTPITVQWYVIEYESGIKVQRGEFYQSSTITNIPISPLSSADQAFILWSKTPSYSDYNWNYDDPIVGDLTNTSNLQFRVDTANSGHVVWWQVVEYLDASEVFVQRGSIFTMINDVTSVAVKLNKMVDENKTFMLVGFRTPDAGFDVGSRMLRGQIINSTTIQLDRGIYGSPDNITEIAWQVVELNEGSRVFKGTENFPSGEASRLIPLALPVDINRSITFATVQSVSGQSMGRSFCTGDDIIGVGSVTMGLSSTAVTMTRDNVSDESDIGWHVIEYSADTSTHIVEPEEEPATVQIVASVYHTRPDGSDAQEIVTSSAVTIDGATSNPFVLNIGLGTQYSFSDLDPRVLRLGINIIGISSSGQFRLAYDSASKPSALILPGNISNSLYLHDADMPSITPVGKRMNATIGMVATSLTFNTTSQKAYWYKPLWSLPTISIINPVQDQHISGSFNIMYYASPGTVSVSLDYFDGLSWNPLGFDTDLDGSFVWDTCASGDGIITLRATGTNAFSEISEDLVTGIEVDCTPPSVHIQQPSDYSTIDAEVGIVYTVDPDALLVEFRYNDGSLHSIIGDAPPDGYAVWNVTGMQLRGVTLIAIAVDEVGLNSQTEVVGLSTPITTPPANKPPRISGVPDIIVHYDYSYNLDLTPYITDEDNSHDELTVFTSDSQHIWISPENNLGLVMNFPQSMLGSTVRITIWVSDGQGVGYQIINVTVLTDYPPEKLRPLPDVVFDEDNTVLNAFFVNLDYYFLDIDGDNLYYTAGNESIRIRINTNNTVDMWADKDWYGFETITIRATDPTGALVEDVVIVQVNPVNDAPTIDPVPEIHVWVGEGHTIDLTNFIHDVDTPVSSLSLSTDSSSCQVSGFNLSFLYTSDIREELVTLTVSDGVNSTSIALRVVIHSPDQGWASDWLLLIAFVLFIIALILYFVRGPQIFAGYLIRKDGTMFEEIQLTRQQVVSYSDFSERIAGDQLRNVGKFNHGIYHISVVNGKEIHLAIVSSSQLTSGMSGKIESIFSDLDRYYGENAIKAGDEKSNVSALQEFSEKFKRIGKKI